MLLPFNENGYKFFYNERDDYTYATDMGELELYRSPDDGVNWFRIAFYSSFSWNEKPDGRVVIVWYY